MWGGRKGEEAAWRPHKSLKSLKMKLVATEVWRVVDEWDQEGNPIYVVKSSNVLTVNPPEELRRKR